MKKSVLHEDTCMNDAIISRMRRRSDLALIAFDGYV